MQIRQSQLQFLCALLQLTGWRHEPEFILARAHSILVICRMHRVGAEKGE